YLFLSCFVATPHLPAFPTRRSSDLAGRAGTASWFTGQPAGRGCGNSAGAGVGPGQGGAALMIKGWNIKAMVACALLLYVLTLLRSEEHTSELQSRENLVCRLLLEKK